MADGRLWASRSTRDHARAACLAAPAVSTLGGGGERWGGRDGERGRRTWGDFKNYMYMYMLMRDDEGRKIHVEASKVKQTTRQSNTAHPTH